MTDSLTRSEDLVHFTVPRYLSKDGVLFQEWNNEEEEDCLSRVYLSSFNTFQQLSAISPASMILLLANTFDDSQQPRGQLRILDRPCGSPHPHEISFCAHLSGPYSKERLSAFSPKLFSPKSSHASHLWTRKPRGQPEYSRK
jgi:hypothetical protein